MQTIEGFDFFPLTFDAEGKLESRQEFDAFLARAKDGPATDAIFIAHGFRNDERTRRRCTASSCKRSGPTCRGLSSRPWRHAVLSWPACTGLRSRSARPTTTKAAGTRGLQNPAEAMAGVERQLDDLKEGASPAQRAKLEKAATLLPALGGNAKKQDEFVALVLSVVDGSHARHDRRAAADPEAEGIRTARETQRCARGGHARHRRFVRRHRRRRRGVPEPDEVVRHEGSVGHGRRQGRGHGRAGAARQMPGRQNPSRRPQPRRPVDGQLREGARAMRRRCSRTR